MRRKDRQMDKEFGLDVIDRSTYGTLSVVDNKGRLINIPLSIVRDGDFLYFHSAREGSKVDIFKSNPRVCISFVVDTKIPENYSDDQLREFKNDPSKAKDLISNVFTTEFASTIINGSIRLVEDRELMIKAMKLICEKYTPSKMEYFPLAVEAGLGRVNVYEVEIREISSKRKKYDSKSIEMRWMRME